jgi:hypothetical protein
MIGCEERGSLMQIANIDRLIELEYLIYLISRKICSLPYSSLVHTSINIYILPVGRTSEHRARTLTHSNIEIQNILTAYNHTLPPSAKKKKSIRPTLFHKSTNGL